MPDLLMLGWLIGVGPLISVPVLLIARLFPSFRNRLRAEQEAIAEYKRAGFKISRWFFPFTYLISGQVGGVRFKHYIVPARVGPSSTVVSIETSAPGKFHVRPETIGTRIVKQLGTVDGFEIDDASFDDKVYFSGTTDEYVRAVFGVRENVERVRALFAEGFDELQKTGTHLMVSRPDADLLGARLLGVTELNSIVEQLATLRLPPIVPGQ